jgi:5-formyltetrahydrofolate cyclo-ligase
MTDIQVAKKVLRTEVRARLRQILPPQRADLDSQIRRRALALAELQRARVVAGYLPLPLEIDTRPLLDELRGHGVTVGLPRVVPGSTDLVFHAVADLVADCSPGCLGIHEPHADLPQVEPGAFDVILVPGLAFTERGARLGRGAGFYDRFLACTPGARIALCYEPQILDSLPVGAHDLRVQVLVTPARVVACG